MIDFTIQTDIERAPEDVFAYVADPAKLAEWQTNTVSAEVEGGGPLRLGSRLREVHRAPGGKELPSVVEVTAFEPGRHFALQVVEGTPIHADIRFEPRDGGTRMAFRAHGEAGRLMRVLQPLLRRQFAQACARVKQQLEASRVPAG